MDLTAADVAIHMPGEVVPNVACVLSIGEASCLRALDYNGPSVLAYAERHEIERLEKRGYIAGNRDGVLRLTDAGKVVARLMPMEK